MQPSLPTWVVLLPFLAGCGSAPRGDEEVPEPVPAPLPASALGGAVRALEALDAVRPEGALAQIRALECDTLLDRPSGLEFVRVFLHLTVFAETGERARAVFDELRLALEAEARAERRGELVSGERVKRVVAELAWEWPGREDLLSYSDAIRLEIRPGRSPSAPHEAGLVDGPELHDSLERYVTRAAASIGPVQVRPSRLGVAQDVYDHRFRIAPAEPYARFTRAEIAAFLSALEGGSPVARVTRLALERSQHEPDVHAERGWTFEAELSVRVAAGMTPAAAVAGR